MYARKILLSLLAYFVSFFVGFSLWDVLLYLFIYPVVDSDSAAGVLLDLISQEQAWHVILTQYVMQSRSADLKFLGHSSLLLVIAFNPLGEFFQSVIPLCLLFWTNIRVCDTFGSISSHGERRNGFQMLLDFCGTV